MDVVSPPQYRRLSRPGPAPQSDVLPRYSRRNTLAQPVSAAAYREPTEHVYSLFSSMGRPWATLKLLSSAKSTKSLPTFFEKENINGSLLLDVDKGDSIQGVSAVVTGRVITGANADDSYTFLNLVVPIWSKQGGGIPTIEGVPSTKLHGRYVWPLSIPIPRCTTMPNGGVDSQSFRLPETFLERQTRVTIQYDFTISISRGRLRSDNQIKTAFGYVPSTRPEAPSILRQLAYEQNLPLPGPYVDPEGWKTLPPALARGVVFKTRKTEVLCTLSLAKPLCYTRGSVLPCFLALESHDPHALDMMSAPTSITVCLRRRIKYYCSLSVARPETTWIETSEDVGTAVWWPSKDQHGNPKARCLEGEIRLAKDLKPNTSVGHFSISYSVVLLPFDVAGFTSADSGPLLAEPVEIATMHAKGPRPLAYSPPAYDPIPRMNNDFHATLTLRGLQLN